MKKFSGIDLHSNNSVVVVSDEVDHIVYQRRLPNDALQIRAALAPHREELEGVVIEATYYAKLSIRPNTCPPSRVLEWPLYLADSTGRCNGLMKSLSRCVEV